LYTALASLLIGTFGALYQVKIKRLLAYSAISHVGFLLISLSILNTDGLFAIIFYILVYILISINLFSIILILRKRTDYLKLKKINEFILIIKSNPLLAFVLCFVLFSIAGIPPLIGFYSKFYVFLAAIKNNLYLVAILSACISVIASMYYIRVIKLMFFKVYDY
jgi:NADH:ubiquinone oxidoreductase subunit 2 (subunit N)